MRYKRIQDWWWNSGGGATHTTNIPNTADCGFVFSIIKSVGTTDRFAYMDWYDLLITRSTAR